jgi:membrane fusion protein (multidrug efflux system)
LFGVVFGILGIKKLLFFFFIASYEPPAVTISASIATPKTWQSYLTSVGTLKAVNGTDISSEASGIVTDIRFESGQAIQKDDALVLLDTSVEQAQLKSDLAALKLAQINNDRNKTLLKKNVLAQSEFDITAAKLEEAQANAEATEAKIKQKTVTAPFAGKMGIRLINIGQYLPAGTAMVTLQSLDPLYVQFNLPEQYLTDLYLQQPVELSTNNSNNIKKTINGSISAINSKVEQSTRNILIQATIPNKELQLYPGMFAQVKILLRVNKNVITLPQTAISYSLHGDSVFVIHAAKKAKEHDGTPVLHVKREYVKVGERRENEVAILDGIKAGDQVVTSGQLKLQNDTHVVIDNNVEF